MLKPTQRITWGDLKKKIYKILKLPWTTPIITSIESFIHYVHNVDRIVLGLVYYLNNLDNEHLS